MNKTPHTFTDVADAVSDLMDDPAWGERIRQDSARSKLVFALTAARCRAGYDLDEFAARMGVSVDELNRIEGGFDEDLSPRQIAAYVLAVVTPPAGAAPPPRTPARKSTVRKSTPARARKRAAALA